jgi:hypothetical protein
MEETQTTHSGWAQKKTRQTAGLLIWIADRYLERPSKRHGPRVRHHAVGAGGILGGIAQDWVIQLQRLGKTDVALDADGRITTSSEVGDVKFP